MRDDGFPCAMRHRHSSRHARVMIALAAIMIGMTGCPGDEETSENLMPPATNASGPPANDSCVSPQQISVPTGAVREFWEVNTRGATADPASAVAGDVWFCWTAPSSASVRLDLIGAVENPPTAIIDVYAACTCPPPGQPPWASANSVFPATVNFSAVGGIPYLIRVGTPIASPAEFVAVLALGFAVAGDPDTDGDGIPDSSDNCRQQSNPSQFDGDHDGAGNPCDSDVDGDGVSNDIDNCRNIPNGDQTDADANAIGDACSGDSDGDGATDGIDNCPGVPNPDQTDADADGLGDGCQTPESDADADGIINASDNCILIWNPDQADFDSDGGGDVCDADDDNDSAQDFEDNCHNLSNPDQSDVDADGAGDACDDDSDGDGIPDGSDNCPLVANFSQTDGDGDGAGDPCDMCPIDPAKVQPGICGCGTSDADTNGDGMPDCMAGRVISIVVVTNLNDQPYPGADVFVYDASCHGGLLLCDGVSEGNGEFTCFDVPEGHGVCIHAVCCSGVLEATQTILVQDQGGGMMQVELDLTIPP